MPYYRKTNYRKKSNYRRRRGGKKTSTAPFSKRTMSMVKSIVAKSINKTRELKSANFKVDEVKINLAGQGVVTTSLPNTYIYNHLNVGIQHYQRIGTQVQPVSLRIKGWAKIDSNSDSAGYYEIKSRIIFARINSDNLQQLEASLASSPIFWNGNQQIMTGDYRDITRNLNLGFLQPIYDRTYTISPNTLLYDSQGTPVSSSTSKYKDSYNIVLNHKFGKNTELRWDNINNDCWDRQNIVCIMFNRMMNDDTAVTTMNVETCMEGTFYYLDA